MYSDLCRSPSGRLELSANDRLDVIDGNQNIFWLEIWAMLGLAEERRFALTGVDDTTLAMHIV